MNNVSPHTLACVLARRNVGEYVDAGIIRVHGYDKSKRPVVYYKPPLCFPGQLGFCHDVAAMRHFFAFYFERLARVADENGAESWNFVVDLKGWSFANYSYTFSKHCMSILQDQFPERLGIVHVVFSPAIFKTAWRIISSMLEPRTRSKFNFISVKDFGLMLNYIDKDVLEQTYGGEHEQYPVKDVLYKSLVGAERPRQVVDTQSPLATTSAISLFEELIESEREEVESKTSEREVEKRSRMTFITSRKRTIQYSSNSGEETRKQQYLLGALKALETALKEESVRIEKRIEALESTAESVTGAYKNDLFMLQKQIQEGETRAFRLQLFLIMLGVLQAIYVVPWIWQAANGYSPVY